MQNLSTGIVKTITNIKNLYISSLKYWYGITQKKETTHLCIQKEKKKETYTVNDLKTFLSEFITIPDLNSIIIEYYYEYLFCKLFQSELWIDTLINSKQIYLQLSKERSNKLFGNNGLSMILLERFPRNHCLQCDLKWTDIFHSANNYDLVSSHLWIIYSKYKDKENLQISSYEKDIIKINYKSQASYFYNEPIGIDINIYYQGDCHSFE